MPDSRVTICSCISRSFIPKEKVACIADVLRKEGYHVTVEADLCRKIMQKTQDLPVIASSVVLACYPRAVRSLFHTADLTPRQVIDIRNSTVQDVFNRMEVLSSALSGEQDGGMKELESFHVENGTDAWYPVIDKERCTECRQCHDFCLFGVYETEDGQVKVKQPQNCKNNCPACARICPQKAIIFPKYEKSPVNGGLEDEEEAVGLDNKTLYAEALRMRLQQRRAKVSLLKKK